MLRTDRTSVRPRRGVTLAGLALGVLALAACTPDGTAAPSPAEAEAVHTAPASAPPLTFRYQARGEHEFIDQTLIIGNDGRTSVAPTLAITAVDATGKDLPDVRVTTAYGSDRGGLVVQPGGGYDVLAFGGPGAEQVAEVKVTVKESAPADLPADATAVEAKPADASGRPMTKFDPFEQVLLKNPNTTPVSVRVVYLVYDKPKPGTPQQTTAVIPIGGLTTIPPGGTSSVPVTGDAAAAVRQYSDGPAVSVKTYFSR
ncbi:hypothetical protein GCM10020229_23560 [Kitasatospora albolonga]